MDDFAPSPDDADPPASLVRPYSRTGGRTRPMHDFGLEALVVPTVKASEPGLADVLSPEQGSVLELCAEDTVSVAEVAARLRTPLGVARVIIADMVEMGLVEVAGTSADAGNERDPAFLRRVLSGLQRL